MRLSQHASCSPPARQGLAPPVEPTPQQATASSAPRQIYIVATRTEAGSVTGRAGAGRAAHRAASLQTRPAAAAAASRRHGRPRGAARPRRPSPAPLRRPGPAPPPPRARPPTPPAARRAAAPPRRAPAASAAAPRPTPAALRRRERSGLRGCAAALVRACGTRARACAALLHAARHALPRTRAAQQRVRYQQGISRQSVFACTRAPFPHRGYAHAGLAHTPCCSKVQYRSGLWHTPAAARTGLRGR
jgi:hypothetical protein